MVFLGEQVGGDVIVGGLTVLAGMAYAENRIGVQRSSADRQARTRSASGVSTQSPQVPPPGIR